MWSKEKSVSSPFLRPDLKRNLGSRLTRFRPICETASPGIFCHTEVHRLCIGAKSLRQLHAIKTGLSKPLLITSQKISALSREYRHLPSTSEVKEVLGTLTPVLPAARNMDSERARVIVVVVEGVVCDYVRQPEKGAVLLFRPEAFSALEYVKLKHKLVLISSLSLLRFQEILSILKREGITPDAAYHISPPHTRVSELWGLDYSQIYLDFHLGNHHKSHCLIVTSIKSDLAEDNSLITGRNILHSHIVRVPVPTKEYPGPPVTILLPHLALQDQGSASLVLLSLVLSSISSSSGFDTGFKVLDYEWAVKLTAFPYSRLWLGTFEAKEQVKHIGKAAGSDPALLLLLQGRHIKPNRPAPLQRPLTPTI